jgi:hypothetical protein
MELIWYVQLYAKSLTNIITKQSGDARNVFLYFTNEAQKGHRFAQGQPDEKG